MSINQELADQEIASRTSLIVSCNSLSYWRRGLATQPASRRMAREDKHAVRPGLIFFSIQLC